MALAAVAASAAAMVFGGCERESTRGEEKDEGVRERAREVRGIAWARRGGPMEQEVAGRRGRGRLCAGHAAASGRGGEDDTRGGGLGQRCWAAAGPVGKAR